METAAFIDQLTVHGAALADSADIAGLDAAVPTCPEWDVRALLAHVGMVHRWATGIVLLEPDASERSDFPAPETGVVDWFRSGHAALVQALRDAPADLDVWAFLPAPSPLAFWARRQAHETAIHRADAESANGRSPSFDREFALDGIAELLQGFYSRSRGRLVADPGFVLQVMPDDAPVSWTIQVGPESRVVTRQDAADHHTADGVQADCQLRGTASDLYLDLWNRERSGATRVDGDAIPMQTWRELATISWS